MVSTKYCILIVLAYITFLLPVSDAKALSHKPVSSADTLSTYKKSSRTISYDHLSIQRQAARFVLKLPAQLEEVSLLMGGRTGSFTLRIWGHEGGSSAPSIGQDLIEPITVYKNLEGMQRIRIPLIGKNIHLSNNQFFIVIEDLPLGMQLLSDSEEKQPSCASDNEKFVWQYLQSTDGRWRYGRFGFAIEAVVSYTKKQNISFASPKAFSVSTNGNEQKSHKNASIACADINGDGYTDVLVNGHLFMNEVGTLVDQTAVKGLRGEPAGNCFIDVDNDGDIDILFIGQSDGEESTSSMLFVNTGDKFHETKLSIPQLDNPTSFSMADVNQDGYIDIFITQSVKNSLDKTKNYLLVNSKNLSFEDRTDEFFTTLKGADNASNRLPDNAVSTSMGASFVDINNDNLPDLYIANYYGKSDELWIARQGKPFVNSKGMEDDLQGNVVSLSERWSPLWYSSGGHWSDIDGNGSMDLLSARYVPSVNNSKDDSPVIGAVLYKRSVNSADAPKIISPFEYEEKQSSGVWGDINNDGKADCILFSSCECRYAEVYQQQNEARFTVVTAEAGLDGLDVIRDGVWVDTNNDGLLDLVCVRADTLLLYINTSENTNSYIDITLESSSYNKQSVGSKVVVYSNNNTFTQQVITGRGLLMQDPTRLHYGLGAVADIDSVIVIWPSGKGEKFIDVSPNNLVKLKEGMGVDVVRNSDVLTNISIRPMPFRDIVELSFLLTHAAHVTVSIFTLEGLPVRKIMNAALPVGEHKVMWDGRNDNGEIVSSGTYLYKCSLDGHEVVGRMIRID